MAMGETLARLRGRYGATMTDDECVELLNAAAWAEREAGYGLSRKEFGTRGRRYDGVECCHDVLMRPDGQYWDCIQAAGAESRVGWASMPSGTITDPRRGWVAPIVPLVGPEVPVPPVTTTLEQRVADLEAWRQSVGRVTTTQGR